MTALALLYLGVVLGAAVRDLRGRAPPGPSATRD